jgi:transposase
MTPLAGCRACRASLVTDAAADVQQLRDLLECGWPAALVAAGSPAPVGVVAGALAVALDRAAGDLTWVHRLGLARFAGAPDVTEPPQRVAQPCVVFDAGGAGSDSHARIACR